MIDILLAIGLALPLVLFVAIFRYYDRRLTRFLKDVEFDSCVDSDGKRWQV